MQSENQADDRPPSLFSEQQRLLIIQQLGISENYDVFMMSTEVDYLSDGHETALVELAKDVGFMGKDDIEAMLLEHCKHVPLPNGFMLVGMHSTKEDENDVYGIVNVVMFLGDDNG